MAWNVLTTAQAKITKGEKYGYLTAILHMFPQEDSRLCPFASIWCKDTCLVFSGRAEMLHAVNEARIRKTRLWFGDRSKFLAMLEWDIKALIRKAKREHLIPVIRLNGTSDVLFEKYIDFAQYPEVQWYDYTKVPLRYRRQTSNYHLTFSFSGENWAECETSLKQGSNVAIVFNVTNPKLRNSENNGLPATYRGFKVVNGVTHDLRFLDPQGPNIIGLIPKGRKAIASAKTGTNPFYVPVL